MSSGEHPYWLPDSVGRGEFRRLGTRFTEQNINRDENAISGRVNVGWVDWN